MPRSYRRLEPDHRGRRDRKRLRPHQDEGVNGALVDPGDWRALAAILADVATRPSQTIDAWRSALPAARTMDDVAADYESLYRELFETGAR